MLDSTKLELISKLQDFSDNLLCLYALYISKRKSVAFPKFDHEHLVKWSISGIAYCRTIFRMDKLVINVKQAVSAQSLSHIRLFATLSITNCQSLLKLMSIESVIPSNHLILCCPLLLLSSIFPSIRVFSKESLFPIKWPKYWSFRFSNSPSNENSGLVSFRIDWFDLLAVQETFESSPTPQFKSINSLVLTFLYGPTLTSIHGYWKNHCFDYMNLYWQSNVSAF